MLADQQKEAAVTDINFVLSECLRLQELIKRTAPGDLATIGPFGGLPSPSGRGELPCSNEALRRIHDLATIALQDSDAAGTIEPHKVFRALRRLVSEHFIKDQHTPDQEQVLYVLSAALAEAKSLRSDATHFIPCRLMHERNPRDFKVGPVKFHGHASFDQKMQAHYAEYLTTGETPQQIETGRLLLPDAQHYYAGFTWVAEIEVLNSDAEISKERAYLAVSAALDCLHLLFGAHHTERMGVGGPRMAEDRRAHLHLNANGALQVSCSSRVTSAVGFPDGWHSLLEREDIAFFLQGAGKAIEPLANPSLNRSIGVRFVDAAAWFGQATREISDGARIVKAVSALERLVSTGETKRIKQTISQRSAALCYDPQDDRRLNHWPAQCNRKDIAMIIGSSNE